MARQTNKLNARLVATLAKPGMHSDGAGLYLRISEGKIAGKRWVFIYRRPGDGKRCEIGFGGTTDVSLARAREKASEARAMVAVRKDPMAENRPKTEVPTFAAMVERHIATMGTSWRNPKHRAQWEMTLREYAKPLADKPVDQVTTADVLSVLTPIWQVIPETASRVRGRIEAVLDSAKAQGFRSGENPAAWRGHLKLVLPARQKLTRGHHAAMPIDDLPDFIKRLRERPSVAARCLEFTILTGARTGESIGARWGEIDVQAMTWTIPAPRTKAGRVHVVPLSIRALAILDEMLAIRDGEFVFPGQRRNQPLSSMALEMLLRRMNITAATVHGMRSTFRDWVGNRTSFPRELAEHALSHVIGDKAEQAYRRDTALERRRPLMEAWAAFCEDEAGAKVVPMRKAAN